MSRQVSDLCVCWRLRYMHIFVAVLDPECRTGGARYLLLATVSIVFAMYSISKLSTTRRDGFLVVLNALQMLVVVASYLDPSNSAQEKHGNNVIEGDLSTDESFCLPT